MRMLFNAAQACSRMDSVLGGMRPGSRRFYLLFFHFPNMSKPKPKFLTYREVEWTPEIDAALGMATDSELGLRFGIAPRSIAVRRRNLGIRSERSQGSDIKWTKQREKLLGTMPDTQLAKQFGIEVYWVRAKRVELGIEAYVTEPNPKTSGPKKRLNLTPARIASLGKSSDSFLASRWGVTGSTVTHARQRLGIPPFIANQEIEWTKNMLDLLGEVPDGRIAREYEVSPVSVKIKRIELKILPFGKTEMDAEPELPKEMIPLIGSVPDKQLSDRFKIPRIQIRLYRAFRGIPLADYNPPTRHTWTEKELVLLGTMSDGAVARKLNIPVKQVTHHRRKLDIAPFDRKGKVRWTKDRIEQLGKTPDHELARNWKIPQREVTKKRESLSIAACKHNTRVWTKNELKLLGSKPDTEIALELGLSPTLVSKKRSELGVPPFKSSAPFDWKPSIVSRLGTIPDDELAMEIGVSYQFVAEKRTQLGIPALRRSSLKWTKAVIQRLGNEPDPGIARDLGCSIALVLLKRKELGIAAFQG
jgi:hypothetical protein